MEKLKSLLFRKKRLLLKLGHGKKQQVWELLEIFETESKE